MANAPVAELKNTPPGKPTQVPPEEQFWIRYSPHNEAPLSGVSSVVLHVLGIMLILLIIWVASKLSPDDEKRPIPTEAVTIAGGGGDKNGVGGGPGGGASKGQEEPVELGSASQDTPQTKTPPPPPQPLNLSAPQMDRFQGDYSNDPAIRRLIKESNAEVRKLAKLPSPVRQSLRKTINPNAGGGGSGNGIGDGPGGRGRGGPGRDGGKGSGKDKGTGPGEGKGSAHLNQREKRVLRWAMTFNTRNGTDYVKQLHGLGAIIALPLPRQRFKVIRDLMHPETGKVEDIADIKRIYWVDDKPQSVQSLCTALRQPLPPYFVAFFPLKLEQRLLDLELAAMKRIYGRTNEDEIHETKFDVINRGGAYDVRVRSVTLRP